MKKILLFLFLFITYSHATNIPSIFYNEKFLIEYLFTHNEKEIKEKNTIDYAILLGHHSSIAPCLFAKLFVDTLKQKQCKVMVFSGFQGAGTKALLDKCNIKYTKDISEAYVYCKLFIKELCTKYNYTLDDFNIVTNDIDKNKINILIEDKSTNTTDNIKYIFNLIKELDTNFRHKSYVLCQHSYAQKRAYLAFIDYFNKRPLCYLLENPTINRMSIFLEIYKIIKFYKKGILNNLDLPSNIICNKNKLKNIKKEYSTIEVGNGYLYLNDLEYIKVAYKQNRFKEFIYTIILWYIDRFNIAEKFYSKPHIPTVYDYDFKDDIFYREYIEGTEGLNEFEFNEILWMNELIYPKEFIKSKAIFGSCGLLIRDLDIPFEHGMKNVIVDRSYNNKTSYKENAHWSFIDLESIDFNEKYLTHFYRKNKEKLKKLFKDGLELFRKALLYLVLEELNQDNFKTELEKFRMLLLKNIFPYKLGKKYQNKQFLFNILNVNKFGKAA